MLVWLLVLLLLFAFTYVVYKSTFISPYDETSINKEQNYTFKL